MKFMYYFRDNMNEEDAIFSSEQQAKDFVKEWIKAIIDRYGEAPSAEENEFWLLKVPVNPDFEKWYLQYLNSDIR